MWFIWSIKNNPSIALLMDVLTIMFQICEQSFKLDSPSNYLYPYKLLSLIPCLFAASYHSKEISEHELKFPLAPTQRQTCRAIETNTRSFQTERQTQTSAYITSEHGTCRKSPAGDIWLRCWMHSFIHVFSANASSII